MITALIHGTNRDKLAWVADPGSDLPVITTTRNPGLGMIASWPTTAELRALKAKPAIVIGEHDIPELAAALEAARDSGITLEGALRALVTGQQQHTRPPALATA